MGKSAPNTDFYYWTPGESCEARDTVFTLGCANQCPRSCADLWDGVQCLQGPCSPGRWPHRSLAWEIWGAQAPFTTVAGATRQEDTPLGGHFQQSL